MLFLCVLNMHIAYLTMKCLAAERAVDWALGFVRQTLAVRPHQMQQSVAPRTPVAPSATSGARGRSSRRISSTASQA